MSMGLASFLSRLCLCVPSHIAGAGLVRLVYLMIMKFTIVSSVAAFCDNAKWCRRVSSW